MERTQIDTIKEEIEEEAKDKIMIVKMRNKEIIIEGRVEVETIVSKRIIERRVILIMIH
jgi:hypothetical protein